MSTSFTHRPLGEIFRDTILGWSRGGELVPLVAGAGRAVVAGGATVRVLEGAGRARGKTVRFSLGDTEWPELGMHSYLYPCVMCVLEGEADIRIGVEGEGTGGRGGGKKAGVGGKGGKEKRAAAGMEVCVYGLPAKTCLIVPPGVPYSDGKTPHWEREDAEAGRSLILWLQILPTGTILHLCETAGKAHTHSSALFIKDAQLSVLMQFMVERVTTERATQGDAADADAVLRSYLTTLLLCVEQNWDSGRIIDSDEIKRFAVTSEQRGVEPSESGDSHGATLERACRYIQSHLTDAMTPEQIARHAYVSVPQLKRIFRARLDTPVMKYVTGRRIEEAKALLLGTGLNIDEIGFICGYPHRTHFSRAFKAWCGVSPQGFRRGERAGGDDGEGANG